MHCRVISGEHKGRKLFIPSTDVIRPTSGRVKESVFNIIRDKVVSANVLDLFAGTGSLGIEAVSNHADSATFVENNKKALEVLKKNLQILQQHQYRIIPHSYSHAINLLNNEKFDIIFIDPPYESNFYTHALEMISKANILAQAGIIILEHGSSISIDTVDYEVLDIRKYGSRSIKILGR